jgi:hypothetical protein
MSEFNWIISSVVGMFLHYYDNRLSDCNRKQRYEPVEFISISISWRRFEILCNLHIESSVKVFVLATYACKFTVWTVIKGNNLTCMLQEHDIEKCINCEEINQISGKGNRDEPVNMVYNISLAECNVAHSKNWPFVVNTKIELKNISTTSENTSSLLGQNTHY